MKNKYSEDKLKNLFDDTASEDFNIEKFNNVIDALPQKKQRKHFNPVRYLAATSVVIVFLFSIGFLSHFLGFADNIANDSARENNLIEDSRNNNSNNSIFDIISQVAAGVEIDQSNDLQKPDNSGYYSDSSSKYSRLTVENSFSLSIMTVDSRALYLDNMLDSENLSVTVATFKLYNGNQLIYSGKMITIQGNTKNIRLLGNLSKDNVYTFSSKTSIDNQYPFSAEFEMEIILDLTENTLIYKINQIPQKTYSIINNSLSENLVPKTYNFN